MWPNTSALWANAIRGGGEAVLNVDAYRGGIKLNTDGPLPIEPQSAAVTVDGGSGPRRCNSVAIANPPQRPVRWTDMLAPAGTELVVTAGLKYADGRSELVPVGVFRIDEPVTAFTSGSVAVHGVDRSQAVDDDKFIAPFQTITTNTVPQEIERIIQLSMPTAVVSNVMGDGTPCPRITWEKGTSPWAAALELAASISADLAPDAAGVFVIRRQPNPSDAPVLTIAVGEAGIIVDGSELMTRENVVNAWTCRNDAADGTAPVQYTAYDLDPDSPTFWGGDFGHKPDEYSSPTLTTITKCRALAESKLLTSTAPARQITVEIVPNPAVDYGDVALIVMPDHSSQTAMVQSFTLPLDVDGAPTMSVQLVSNIAVETPGPVVPPSIADVVTYTPHSSIASTSKYQVTVNGQPSFVYSTFDDTHAAQPHWGKFTTFSMGAGQVTVSISTDYDVTSCIVRPSIQGVRATIVGPRQITLVLTHPGNYSVEPNANPAVTDQTLPGSTNQIDPLFLFASPLESKPSPSDPNVYAYFSEGQVYTGSSVVPGNGSTITVPSTGDLVIPSNKTVYIEGGAVFKGRLVVGATGTAGAAASGIVVDGRGIVDATWQATPGNPVKVYKCSSTSVSNIVALSCNKWAFRVFGCTGTLGTTGVFIRNTRTFSWADPAKAGTPTPDGMDCVGSTGVTFDGVFVRSRDDGLTMKNATPTAFDGGVWTDNCHDNLVQNFCIWNGDAGNALEIGYETGGSSVSVYNVTYQHGDIIHKTANQGNSNSRGAIGIHNHSDNGAGGTVHDIRYEDIRIEDVIGDNTNSVGSDSYIYLTNVSPNNSGDVDHVYLKDVSVFYSMPSLAIQVRGNDTTDQVTDVTFENCTVNGTVLTTANAAANGYVHTSGNDSNVTFIGAQSTGGGGGGTDVTVAATVDAWVRNNGTQSGSPSVDNYLRVKNSATATVQRRSLLQFDATASGLTSCTTAILRLWHIGNDSGIATTIDVYSAASDTWTEAVTWATQPALGTLLSSTVIDPGHVAGNAPSQQYFEWDVTAFTNTQLAGDKVISLMLWQATASDNQVTFSSREAVANVPQLVLSP